MARHFLVIAAILCALMFSGVSLGQDKASTPTPTPKTSAPGKTPTSGGAATGDTKATPMPTGPISIVGQPVIKIEGLCNAAGEGTAKFQVKNTGKAGSFSPVAADITSKSPAKTLANAKIDFPDAPKILPANQTEITAKAAGVFDEGDYEAQVQSQGAVIGSVRIVRASVPLSVSVDVANPEAPELTFVDGEEAHFRLKNADSVPYTLAWDYTVDGVTACSSQPAATTRDKKCNWFCKDQGSDGKMDCSRGELPIMAGGQQNVSFVPPPNWFPDWFSGLFKENVTDGYLTIYRIDSACQEKRVGAKTIKVKTHRMRWAPGIAKELWGDIFIFLALAAGGIMSLLLNFALPNQTRRLKIKQQLEALGEKVGNLSWALASRLRVLAGLQYRLISDQLRSMTGTDSDFSTEMQGIEKDMAQLSTRLDFLAALGAVRVNFEKSRADDMPPSTMFALEEKFKKAVEIGKKTSPTDAELQSAQALITEIQQTVDSELQVTDAAVTDMAKRTKEFKALFDAANGVLGKTTTGKDVRAKLPGLFNELDATQEDTWKATPPTKGMFVVLDRMLFKLRLLAEYVRRVEGLASGNPLRDALVKQQPALIDLASKNSWNAMYDGDRLLREMEAGIFADDIGTELQAKKLRIDWDPQIVHPHRPVQFSLKFLKCAYNDTPATEEWTCRWTFSREHEDDLTEEGWTVTHYFQQADKEFSDPGSQGDAAKPAHAGDGANSKSAVRYSVKVEATHSQSGVVIAIGNVERLRDGTISVSGLPRRSMRRFLGKVLTLHWNEAEKEWRKSRTGAGRMLDRLRLLLALVIALIGLLAGAKEQLLKLDVLPALVAIFLLGFGADQVKNLFTQKPAGADTGAQH